MEARLKVQDCKILGEHVFGRTLVGYFDKSLNPEFIFSDTVCYSKKSISPCDIIAAYPYKEFVKFLK